MQFDFEIFQNDLYEECAQVFPIILAELEKEKIYGIVLYYSCAGWGYLFPSVFTEAGLTQVSEEYKKDGFGEEAHLSLKWSPCDSPNHTKYESHLPKTARTMAKFDQYLTQQHERDEIESDPPDIFTNYHDEAIEKIRHSTTSVLKKLTNDGLLGEHKETILVTLMSGDQDEYELLEDTKFINSPTQYQAFKDYWELSY